MKDRLIGLLAFVRSRQGDYRQVFRSPQGQRVLADLARFCRARSSTYRPDPHMQAYLAGRRDVFLRIADHINLDVSEIYKLDEKDLNSG